VQEDRLRRVFRFAATAELPPAVAEHAVGMEGVQARGLDVRSRVDAGSK
jgi:hypothetical protein